MASITGTVLLPNNTLDWDIVAHDAETNQLSGLSKIIDGVCQC